jgi:hypothetical protein
MQAQITVDDKEVKSVSRVHADVNALLDPSWSEYGKELVFILERGLKLYGARDRSGYLGGSRPV